MKIKGKEPSQKSTGDVIPSHHEEPVFKSSHSPGKKGGLLKLPFGATIMVPENILIKKDVIKCRVSPASERRHHLPPLSPDRQLISELYQITLPSLKTKSVRVSLPFMKVNYAWKEVYVVSHTEDHEEWKEVPLIQDGSNTSLNIECVVEFEAVKSGSYAVLVRPRRETFVVPTHGCLYVSRLTKYLTVRFPKKCADVELECFVETTPVSDEKRQLTDSMYPSHAQDIAHISQLIEIGACAQQQFRRAVTVKLPLPASLDPDTCDMSSVAVLRKDGRTDWTLVDTPYKFTKTTVSFDVKHLSKYCVTCAKPDRKKRLVRYLPLIEKRMLQEVREVIVFASLERKSWLLVVECVKISDIESIIRHRLESGFKRIEQKGNKNGIVPNNDSNGINVTELWEGYEIEIKVGGDVKVLGETAASCLLRVLLNMTGNCERIFIEPESSEERALVANVSFSTPRERSTDVTNNTGFNDHTSDVTTCRFDFIINEDIVKDYFYTPKPPPEPVVEAGPPSPIPTQTEPIHNPSKTRVPSSEALMRLSQSRRISLVEREPKVLTGRSLRCIAKYINEGLTLAVHLSLPDSTITGIGFDALASGHGMVDVTYKILLYWKRITRAKKDGAVQQLAVAISDMGYAAIAAMLLEHHRVNKELTDNSVLAYLHPPADLVLSELDHEAKKEPEITVS